MKVKYPLFLVVAAHQKKNKGNLFKRAGKGDVRQRADTSVQEEAGHRRGRGGEDGLAAAGTGSSRGNLKTEPVTSSQRGGGEQGPVARGSRRPQGREEAAGEGSLW